MSIKQIIIELYRRIERNVLKFQQFELDPFTITNSLFSLIQFLICWWRPHS